MFEKEMWPKGFAVNGWVLVDGEKMSKSKGNFFTLKELITNYSADVVRFTLCNAGEGLDDPNWELSFAETAGKKLENWLSFVKKNRGKGRKESHPVDDWFRAIMSDTAYKATKASDRLKFRTSTRLLFFELPQYYKWYLQRVGEPNSEVLHEYLSMITRGIAPVVPHIAEEAWSLLDEEGFVIDQQFPKGKESDIGFLIGEDLVKQTLEDTKAILNIAKIEKPSEIVLITSPKWKWDAVQTAGDLADGRGQVKLNQLIGNVMPQIPNESKKVGAEFLKKWVLKDIPSLGPDWQERYKVQIDEKAILESSLDFFSKIFGCPVSVINAEKAVSRLEPKSKQSAPLRPAIFVS
tara:strand:- start:109 stop:1158 length:1050 start_codon:yes stop_codon:yes gene_type:complete